MNKAKQYGMLLMVTTVLLVTGCGSVSSEKDSGAEMIAKEEPTKAEEITEETTEETTEEMGEFATFAAYNLDMEIVNQDVLKGHDLTMINIWGTFCGPCIKEMPDLGAIGREYADKSFQIIGIAVDVSDDTMLGKAKEIVEKTEADYLHLLPSQDLSSIYLNSVAAIPETLFVDEKGKILKSVIGSKSKEVWIKEIDEMLKIVKSE